MRIRSSVIFLAASLGIGSLPAAEVDTSLIESVVLLNFEALRGDSLSFSETRIRRAAVDTGLIDLALPDAPAYKNTAALKATFKALLETHTDVEIANAVKYAFDYTLGTGMTTFGLSFEDATGALELFTEVAFEESVIPEKLAENLARSLLTDVLLNWAIPNNTLQVPVVGREVARAIGKGALKASFTGGTSTAVAETLVSELTIGALEVLEDATADALGFYKGITVVVEGSDNTVMLYDGESKKFHPEKARLIEHVVNGAIFGTTSGIIELTNALANNPEDINGNGKLDTADKNGDGVISGDENEDNNNNNALDRSDFLVAIGTKAAAAAVTQLSTVAGDNSLFLYETVKAVGYGASLGAVLATEHPSTENLTLGVAENIAFGVASGAMAKVLSSTALSATADIARVGEAAAYGTAVGTGLAGSMLTTVDRATLAQVAAAGAAIGALEEAANKKGNTEIENDELLALARGTAMGSVLGSVAMAVYNHLNASGADVQEIIGAAALGTAFGSMSADLVPDGDANGTRNKLPGHKEDFEVEIARATANGATTGALFEIISLLQSMPHLRTADIDSIKTAQSASYGVTKGAIIGGDAAGVSSGVSVKQATEQGATEGSLQGVALALPDAEIIRSESAIKHAVGVGNQDGALDAARSLALKAINPTVQQIRQLMKLYGINPGLTNPGFIFPNPNRSGEDNFLFPPDEIPVVSPI